MVKPLHFQDSLSKIPLLQKIQEAARMAPEVTKDRATEELKKHDDVKAKAAQDAKETEKSAIGEKNAEDRKRRKKNVKRKQIKRNQEEGMNEELEDDTQSEPSGRIIDLFA